MMNAACFRYGVLLWMSCAWASGVLIAADAKQDGDANGADSRVFRAGAFAMDITPVTLPIGSAGSMTPREVTRVHDPLHARCLVLDDGNSQIAFAICDSCMIPRWVMDAAKEKASEKTGIPADRILISATHTHTAVTATHVFQSPTETEYCEFLADKIADGIARSIELLQPAKIGWAVGNNPRQVFNRRWYMRPGSNVSDPFDQGTDRVRMNPPRDSKELLKPAGLVDPEVAILAVESTEGRPIAVLANYSLHYVGGVPADSLSADYFGEFARQLANRFAAEFESDSASKSGDNEPAFVGIMSNGTSGDINNINFFEGMPQQDTFEQIRLVGADLADTVHSTYQRIEFYDWVPLQMREAELNLGVRRPSDDDVRRAKEVLAAAGDPPYRDRQAIYANETVDMAKYPESVSVKLQAMRIGDLGIVSSPCETFVETGLAIKQQSALKPTFTIELANGYNGYLPTPEQHALGGYETWRAKSSYLAVDAEPQIRATLLKLLGELVQE
ncbi:Neutral/alkaline non-lysosomal ceramidase [Rubripirellula lacrimiformis]|uniref:Neutral/alkaline non-lysosomal ceramidase n=1 Tax=Rubripirellula lacrimiformis TaxID=1930273 RepID=A0A517NAF4_9BACT|nr:hypothetical protein [Rubripirellula lacrimiformis]QDT04117.1 Neutral/alkaline non-lysosomal ceramidase [Rubripirellula lacrimiformis]